MNRRQVRCRRVLPKGPCRRLAVPGERYCPEHAPEKPKEAEPVFRPPPMTEPCDGCGQMPGEAAFWKGRAKMLGVPLPDGEAQGRVINAEAKAARLSIDNRNFIYALEHIEALSIPLRNSTCTFYSTGKCDLPNCPSCVARKVLREAAAAKRDA